MKKMRRITAWLMAVCMLFPMVGLAAAEDDPANKFGTGIYSVDKSIEQYVLTDPDMPDVPTDIPLTQRQVFFYMPDRFQAENDPDACKFEATLYFPENMPSVPYMEIGYAMHVIFYPLDGSSECDLEECRDETAYIFSRPNGSSVVVDFSDNTITIEKYDHFMDLSNGAIPMDVASFGTEDGMMSHETRLSLPGHTLRIDLSDYGIHMMRYNDEVYIPMHTFSDLFVSCLGFNWVWNGEALFEIAPESLAQTNEKTGESQLTVIGSMYYAQERKGLRPDDLIWFTYRELCLALDVHYGLKAEHGISSFNEYMIRSGLILPMLSEDPEVFYKAMCDLTELHLADNHSGTNMDSPFGDPFRENAESDGIDRTTDVIKRLRYYKALRTEVTGNQKGPDGYTEYGDTAFITFDSFSYDKDVDYRNCKLQNDPENTIMLILYAHQQITRKNSPIINVVIDLSCNGGGTADAAAAVIAWFLSSGSIQIENALTKEKGIVTYKLDANRDGVIDEKDDLPGNIRKFCFISGGSFSCGNLVPYAFRASDEVILIGRRSGGGACAVQPLITADGVLFRCSGRERLSVATNGSFTSVDEGVMPDYVITDMSMLYCRKEMAEYLDGLW